MPNLFSRLVVGIGVLAAVLAMATSAARTDWLQDIGTFRIGLLAGETGDAEARLPELKDAYAKALGAPVEIFVATDYAALIEAQATGRVDYAAYSATAYAVAAERCGCVEPLAAPVGLDRSLGIRSVLITRDDRLPALEDLPERRVAVASADSVAGRLLPFAALAHAGFDFTSDETSLVQVASVTEAEERLVDGSVDAMFGWIPSDGVREDDRGGTLDRLVAAGLDRSRLKVVWRSDLLRYGPHAVRTDLDREAKRRLRVFLLQLSASPDLYDLIEPARTGGFVAVSDADYRLARDMVRLAAGRLEVVADPAFSRSSR